MYVLDILKSGGGNLIGLILLQKLLKSNGSIVLTKPISFPMCNLSRSTSKLLAFNSWTAKKTGKHIWKVILQWQNVPCQRTKKVKDSDDQVGAIGVLQRDVNLHQIFRGTL